MKTELHKCDACGKTAKLESGKRHWCDCNPRAPFYMISVRIRKVTDQLINGNTAPAMVASIATGVGNLTKRANADLIVRAVNDRAGLLARVAELESVLKKMISVLNQTVQTGGLCESATCYILRGDSMAARNLALHALAATR